MSKLAEAYAEQTGHYPEVAGWKEPTTSRDAAEALRGLPEMQAAVLKAIRSAGDVGATADEVAAVIGLPVLTVRPRVSELRAIGRIGPSRFRRANASGHKAIAWKAIG